jgi:tetratricopeptide (TPR) repeat protein
MFASLKIFRYFFRNHLADIMSRAALLYGDEALLNDYNERVDKKLNAKSSETEGKCSKTVGVNRAMQQMVLDIETYEPFDSYMGVHTAASANFNAKNQLYRLISLLLSDLGMIFDIRCPSPWLIISELLARGIISESQSFDMRECLSFANEIRLRTYLANKGQRELISPVPHHANPKQQSAHAAVFQDVNQHILVRFLSTSNDIHKRCKEFCIKSISEDKIDSSIFRNTTAPIANALLLGLHYYRLQNFHEALEWMKTESEESPFYVDCLVAQGNIYLKSGEYDKSIKCFEEAMQLGYQKRSNADVAKLYNGLANALIKVGKYKMAVVRMEEGISKHTEIFGEKFQSNILLGLLASLGYSYHILGDFRLALKTLKEALEMQKELKNVPDVLVAFLNMIMAVTLSELGQYAESIEYIEKALQLSYQIFGKDNLSINLAETYNVAGKVYGRCNRKDEAVSFFRRSVELYERIVGDNPHPGMITTRVKKNYFLSASFSTHPAPSVSCVSRILKIIILLVMLCVKNNLYFQS